MAIELTECGGCGGCECQGMFKQLVVDIPLPTATGSITGEYSWNPTWSHQLAFGYLSYPQPAVGIFGNLSPSFVPIEYTPPSVPSNVLYLRIYNPCNSGYAFGPYKAVNVNMNLPTQIRVGTNSRFGYCEGIDESEGYIIGPEVYFSGYIPQPYPCSPPTPDWVQDPPSGQIFVYESFQNYTSIFTGSESADNGILDVYFSNVEGSTDFSVDDNLSYAVNGVSLKNLNTDITYPAIQSTFGKFGSLSFAPLEGTHVEITFSDYNRTTPGDYELTWPLLKAPYKFTIPAP